MTKSNFLRIVVAIAICLATTVQVQSQSVLNRARNAAQQATQQNNRPATQSSQQATQSNQPAATTAPQSQASGQTLYVHSASGNNRNDGSKGSPLKNIQRAIEMAADGATILVAEGNYFGALDRGNINITKPVKIYGGYSSDFSTRDVLKYQTMVQPSPVSNGTQNGQGTMQVQVKEPNTEVVIDGLIFDRGNAISYNSKGEGQPKGVESPKMNPIGSAGIGGAALDEQVGTTETAQIYLDNVRCNLTVNNCAFINAPNYGIRGMFGGKKAVVNNCIFINNRMAACEITSGGLDNERKELYFSYNTVLFMWQRKQDASDIDMGYGFRYMTRIDNYVTNNIIGCTMFSGIDHTRIDSDKAREAARISVAKDNIFFLTRDGDLTLPGGGMYMTIKAEQFEDVEQLDEVGGNKTLNDPSLFKGIINEAYLEGFLNLTYSEKAEVNYQSSVNTFRQAMGMNLTGTITSTVSMYANRYPWRDALKFFGAMQGYGAQTIEN